MKIMHVVGARPNFMKVAPVMREMACHPSLFQQVLVHTGQHYDDNMSKIFFDELGLPEPDINLSVGSGTHAWQTAQIMMRLDPLLTEHRPDWVFVPGDVNSTVASALVCSKTGVRLAHVEAGLRSFDRSMPEEINRLVTDQLADLLLTPSRDADENLLREGIAPEKIRFVGNIMIDTLVRLLPKAEQRWGDLRTRYSLSRFALVTLHRPSNVDRDETLSEILDALHEIGRVMPVIFPVHPRTRGRMAAMSTTSEAKFLQLIEPLGYLDFLALQIHAALVLTDSGGVQEETTYLGIPCLTLRPNTERPITITEGTNRLVRSERTAIVKAAFDALSAPERCTAPPRLQFWDGRTAKRIVEAMRDLTVPEHAN
ncbi:MAG: UDP-N-acetylglucosamine 2-epimerase (non-hydrolyzing) [Acidobacteriales bacterium]|nr:UDP-N-acetylglucosamine 2-epimerase (non-hydrolyzing) [Terriglobales bacterium]